MDFGKDIINPAFLLAMNRMKENNNAETQNKMVEEALNARFLVPCIMEMKAGTEKDKKRTPENTTPRISMIKTTDGRTFFIAFTDLNELNKWQKNEDQNVLVMSFDDIAGMVLNQNVESEGFVVNPASTNVVFQKKMVFTIIYNRDKALAEGKLRVMTDKEVMMQRYEQEKEARAQASDSDLEE